LFIDKKEAKRKYKKLFDELNVIICSWDPYGLIRSGAPKDEWYEEVTSILAGLRQTSSKSNDDVIDLVQNVFSKAFSKEDFPRERCEQVGNEIYEWWIEFDNK
jgi:hypothetical protein